MVWKMDIYVVQPGDTVDVIASYYGINAAQIIFDNQLLYPYPLAVGQALFIGGGSRRPDRAISTSGYAYPFISPWVLRQTLPYLSKLPIFSYGFTGEGELIPPLWSDEPLIVAALEYGTTPTLVLTPFGRDGQFNNLLISSIVNEPVYAENLIQNLVALMQKKGYQGLDIDFEYILAEDRDAFTAFVRKTAERMRENGYFTSVALAPKTSADQRGLLYEGKDYSALGEVADFVLLMTYEWGYTFSPPMAVAPVNQVRQVVEYAVTEIPSEKIDLGIPNYGYDWALPFERGVTRATTIGNIQAVQIAIREGAEILFDTLAQSPYFRYTDKTSGVEHEVWFEDVRSLQAKFDLIKEYRLRGCGYWQIMQWFRANWLLLYDNFYVIK